MVVQILSRIHLKNLFFSIKGFKLGTLVKKIIKHLVYHLIYLTFHRLTYCISSSLARLSTSTTRWPRMERPRATPSWSLPTIAAPLRPWNPPTTTSWTNRYAVALIIYLVWIPEAHEPNLVPSVQMVQKVVTIIPLHAQHSGLGLGMLVCISGLDFKEWLKKSRDYCFWFTSGIVLAFQIIASIWLTSHLNTGPVGYS